MRKILAICAVLLATQLSGCCAFFWHGCGYHDGGGDHRDDHRDDDHGGYR